MKSASQNGAPTDGAPKIEYSKKGARANKNERKLSADEIKGNLRRLLPYLKPQRKTIALAIGCLIVAGLLDFVFLLLFERVLGAILNVAGTDKIIASLRALSEGGATNAELGARVRDMFVVRPVDFSGLNLFAVTVLLVGLGQGISDYGQTYLTQRIGQRVLTQLRADIYGRFQQLSLAFFERRRTGELMSRMTNDLSALQGLMSTAIMTSIKTPIATVGALGYIFWKKWELALFVLLILPLVAFLINRAGRRIRVATTQMQAQVGELTNYLQEKLSAMRLIQIFGMQQYEVAQFAKVNEESYRRAMKPVRIRATLAPTIDFIGLTGVLLTLWFGARSGMAPAALMTFLFAVHRCGMNFKAIAGLHVLYSSAAAAAERLFEILDMQPEIQDKPDAIDLKERDLKGHLAFENVRFSYANDHEVLHGISFEMQPGEVVALAGLSGSGKTTISNLVPRLYDPTAGRVLVDGLDLRDVKVQSLRAHIGAVPQETTLFHGTIAENIAYGKPDASRDEIVEAARRANAHNFISEQPEGYDTHIGERGGRLSGGQRQRIAIARALLRNPRILILDEATSSLDAESESLVQDALATLMKGRTTLIIAHRFSTIRHAHKIIVLENGNIAETGTHDDLLAHGGIYKRLYEMQMFSRDAETAEEIEVDEADELSETADFVDQRTRPIS